MRALSQEQGEGFSKHMPFDLQKLPPPRLWTAFSPHCPSSWPSLVLSPTGPRVLPLGSHNSPISWRRGLGPPLSEHRLSAGLERGEPGYSVQRLLSSSEPEQGSGASLLGWAGSAAQSPPRALSWGSTQGPAGRGAENRMVMT